MRGSVTLQNTSVSSAQHINGSLPASKVKRRVGLPPSTRGSATNCTCPDIFELANGDFAVIGTEATDDLEPHLPTDAARADYERIVVVSRATLLAAKRDIPDR